jgi:hypothetical protein
MSEFAELFAKLAEPFPEEDIEWRAGATNREKTQAMALPYITARSVMDRLDEVVGPQDWKDIYTPGPDGGVACGLSLRLNGEWITKWDAAENTNFEGVKGGISDALKRAAVKWGIGRYLYEVPTTWVDAELRGNTVVLKSTPKLSPEALPKGTKPKDKPAAKAKAWDENSVGPDEMDFLIKNRIIPEDAHPNHVIALLNLSPFKPDDKLDLKWLKLYRGLRDEGLKSTEAAKKATQAYGKK